LFCFWKRQFNYVNEIEPLVEIVEKLHPLVFTAGEVMGQPFVYHYAIDEDDCLTVGDGSDR
jgi:hypothetical protein